MKVGHLLAAGAALLSAQAYATPAPVNPYALNYQDATAVTAASPETAAAKL